jgi:PAS domain S-box-containing protein
MSSRSQNRTVVLAALILGALAFLVSLWLADAAVTVAILLDRYADPFLITVLAAALVPTFALLSRRREMQFACYGGLALVCAVALGSLVLAPGGPQRIPLATALAWMPLLYVAAFLFFRPGQALLAAGAAFVAALAPPLALVTLWGPAPIGDEARTLLVNAAGVHLLTLVALALLAFLHGRFRDLGVRARSPRGHREELRAALDVNRTTLENMDQGLLMFDADERLQVFNKRALVLLGLPHALLERRPTFDEIVTFQEAHGEFAGDSAPGSGVPEFRLSQSPTVYERTRPDGTVLEIRTVFLDAGGAVRTYTDQTARRSAEARLKESDERYRLLAENTADIIILTSLDRTRLYVSPASRDILGYAPEDMLAIPTGELVHPDDLPFTNAHVDTLLAGGGEASTTNYRMRHRDGRWIPLEARRRILRDGDGRPQGLVSVVRDISERVVLEEKLRQAQKMEAVGQLTGGIAHDFNNLLTVVIGHTERLLEDLVDQRQRHAAAEALRAAERGAHLTQQLLAFGRRQSLCPERLALCEVVSGMVPMLRRTLGKDVVVKADGEAARNAAFADRALLESAILNLALNARDAMPEGGTLTITTGEREAHLDEGNLPAGQPVAFLTVSDTGTGMTPDVLAKVFEPFFTTKDVGKGTGLGLSMVYGFAEQSGGHVSIESAPGQGTAVTILLRAVPLEVPAPAQIQGRVRPVPGGRERILVVEDEPQVLAFVSGELADLGYEVTGVSAGEAALEHLGAGADFDLLLTDVALAKGVSGVEVAERARAMRPGLKVLLTSGRDGEASGIGSPTPCDAPLLPKPYRTIELAEAVHTLLKA